MEAEVLIVGAGVAGLSAAAALAARGIKSLVVEESLFPGGHAASLSCKATRTCAKCNACLLEETLAGLAGGNHHRLACLTSATSARPVPGGYRVGLTSRPVYLDPDRCTACGLCLESCPARGRAIRRAPAPVFGPGYGLEAAACLYFNGQDCRACLEVCPAGAVDLSATGGEAEVEVRAVVVAAGFVPFDPRLKPHLGSGRLSDVVSALEVETRLRTQGALRRPSDGRAPARLAFVQCVGSRDRRLGRDYCSRVCCAYALRLARLIRHRWPETGVSFFYMDVQTFGRNFDRFFAETQGEVELIHGLPGEITAGEDGTLRVPFLNEATGAREAREFDLVVLSVGLDPPEEGLDKVLGLGRDEDGFLVGRPEQGLFVTGAAAGPADVAEARARGEGTAAEVAAYLAGGPLRRARG